MSDDFHRYLQDCKQRIDQALSDQLGSFCSPYSLTDISAADYSPQLQQAMRYSLLNGGKRVRPLLVYAAAAAITGETDSALDSTLNTNLDRAAAAVEMIHAYSLVHDDLPAMDDDDLRRGQATCHRAFDEATAILAGDALQSRAFELLTELQDCPPQQSLQLIKQLACAAGQRGMVAGQAIDLSVINQQIDLQQLETLHRLKTGALIRAAIAMGATLAGACDQQLAALDSYGDAIGLAFQVQDDILDIESDTAILGKTQGADIALNKPTYPALLGLDGAKQKAQQLQQQALSALVGFDNRGKHLAALASYIVERRY
jgi:geranylgeranyl pyrophosphate synthase